MTDTHASAPRRRRHLATAALAISAVALAAAAGSAQARIVPGVGVAGVAVGDTEAAVRSTLGAPEAGSNALNYRYIRGRGFGIYFIAGRVYEITVVRRPEATAKGIGVGSKLAALRKAYPAAACRRGVVGRDAVECTLAGRRAGRATETLFVTRAGRVTSIAVRFAG
ncbi:MAG: hypothetical protein AB1416_01465 [Actinomycetota bacterium]